MKKILLALLLITSSTFTSAAISKNVLMVLTSFDGTANSHPTGFWAEELVKPYKLFIDKGHKVTLASPKGGHPPVDPGSINAGIVGTEMSKHVQSFLKSITRELNHTKRLSELSASNFDAIFIVGGHGAIWDLVKNDALTNILLEMDKENKVIAAICHGPAAFVNVRHENGDHLLKGHLVTGFSYQEEKLINLIEYVESSPMKEQLENLLEDATGKNGQVVGNIGSHQYKVSSGYISEKPWSSFSIISGNIVTGQNPSSSLITAKNVINLLDKN